MSNEGFSFIYGLTQLMPRMTKTFEPWSRCSFLRPDLADETLRSRAILRKHPVAIEKLRMGSTLAHRCLTFVCFVLFPSAAPAVSFVPDMTPLSLLYFWFAVIATLTAYCGLQEVSFGNSIYIHTPLATS